MRIKTKSQKQNINKKIVNKNNLQSNSPNILSSHPSFFSSSITQLFKIRIIEMFNHIYFIDHILKLLKCYVLLST